MEDYVHEIFNFFKESGNIFKKVFSKFMNANQDKTLAASIITL